MCQGNLRNTENVVGNFVTYTSRSYGGFKIGPVRLSIETRLRLKMLITIANCNQVSQNLFIFIIGWYPACQ